MCPDDQHKPTAKPSREERQAKALRENLARRKALARAQRKRESAETAAPPEGQGSAVKREEDPEL
ncbi:hypothetical protein [Hyphomicrobium sp. LHD-15]|uniref:hypothetical protein n=1 Tax=Hyphomicrobium sp. LHD-15 TaxID=3072142 RepID=UPI00280EE27C|nr:hypothetical protein [Hyphomicrobium sp. LHD-15]MDQ8699838.1 hypothetical protein [Hyphomicrobium sp. LHD-15]